ncbi:hypothetical protein [Synechococcus sp. CS-1328]|uniref:hypothetical protein n=1 Tax=Synechococcus sp. CS-1328 TaxID=2847976 RepID=UPI00223B93FF|nr:hypothetical protein [Synechococcus sp. CS-1328]MCT0225343.1 hypothetical protein [Synechococcus sp. CS-1328]
MDRVVSSTRAISTTRAVSTTTHEREPVQDLDALKERQLLVRLVAELGAAQFAQGNGPRSERLWREAAQMGLDPERITHLLYGGQDLQDREALLSLDRAWTTTRPGHRSPAWSRPAWLGGQGVRPRPAFAAHRSAPPATAPARRAGR